MENQSKTVSHPDHTISQEACGYGCGEWPGSGSSWLFQVPWGLRKLLRWIKEEYNDPEIYITENGISTKADGYLDDEIRTNYYKNYLHEVLKGNFI